MSNILVIDDDPELRMSLKLGLEQFEHTVSLAEDGDSGIAMYQEGSFDLVITDINMPGTDGLQAIQQLRKINPEILLIAISGMANHKDALLDVARQVGAKRILPKPFTTTELAENVRAVLEEHGAG